MPEATAPTQKEISLLKEARETLRLMPSGPARNAFYREVEQLAEAYDKIKISCTRSALREMIAYSTLVMISISRITTPSPNPPKADAAREKAEVDMKVAVA